MALFPPRAPIKTLPRGDFDAEAFRRLIFQNGAQVIWEQAHQCPCGRKVSDLTADMEDYNPPEGYVVTGESPVECARCGGIGFFLTDAQTIPAVVSSMRGSYKRFAHAGEYIEGTIYVSTLPEHKMAAGHRITMGNSVHVVREARRRTAAAVEALRFPIYSQALDLSTGSRTVRTLWVQKANASNVSTTGDALVEGTDFVVTAEGKIDWSLGVLNGKAPALNTFYTVEYYARPRYRVTDILHSTRDTFVQSHAPTPVFTTLPLQVMARLEFAGEQVAP